MTIVERLLGIEQPAGATLHSWELALRGGVPGWAVALLGLAGIAAAGLLYWRERADLSRGVRGLLVALRGAALLVLVGLIARPVLVTESHGERPRDVALLVDDSASMKQQDRRTTPLDVMRVAIAKGAAAPDASADAPEWQSASREELGQPSRADLARAVLANPRLDWAGRLTKAGPLRASLFGARPRRVEMGALAKSITAGEDRTAIADSILEVISGKDGDPPAAIVLITDGVDNASRATTLDEVAAECVKQGVAIHVYGVGSTDSGVIRLIDAAIPETLFYDDLAVIPVHWQARGIKSGVAAVSVTFQGKEVAHKEFPLTGHPEGKDVISFAPDKARQPVPAGELTVSIRLKDENGPADEFKKPVTLSERKVRVLVVDDAPRWEFKFLQPALSRDRRVEASYLVAQGDPRAMKGDPFVTGFPNRGQLFKYDLVILGDVPPAFLGPDGMTALQDFVREGGGLAVVAGRNHMPGDYVDTPLAEVLPVEFVPVKFPPLDDSRPTPYQPELTAAGRRTEILFLGDTPAENDKLWKELPGFYWHYPATKLRAGATTLVAHPRKLADDTPMPLVASQFYGKGQVLWLAADETWRWRFNSGDKLFARFWGQVVYQLGLPHLLNNGKRALLALDRSDAVVGRPGYVYARMFDAEFKPYVVERIPATLESLDAPTGEAKSKPVALDPLPGRPGEYRALLPHDTAGRYELKLTQPEAATLAFRVQLPPGHESEPNALADAPLRQLAQATGGAFYREEDLHKLPAAIVPKTAPFVVRQEVLLWNPLAMLLFVGLVTAEWIARKLVNLT